MFVPSLLITSVAFVAYTVSIPETRTTLQQLFQLKNDSSGTVYHDGPIVFASKANVVKPPTASIPRVEAHGPLQSTPTILSNIRHHFHNMSSVYDRMLPISVLSHIPEANCDTNRFLVYKCISTCGGMGDRQKGMTSAFLFALLTNRTFIIDMPNPCDISQFFQANVYDWQKCRDKIKRRKVKVHSFMDGNAEKFKNRFPHTNFDQLWTDEVIYIQTNVYFVEAVKRHPLVDERIPWLNNRSREDILGHILGVLFRVKENILNGVVEFAQNYIKGKDLVCAHVRCGRNPSIPNDGMKDKSAPNVHKILSFLKSYEDGNKYTVYVASDSENVRQECRKMIGNCVVSNQTIFHIDRSRVSSRKTACDGFSTVIFEQLMLSRCDVLLLTRSNFGAMAAYERGRSENLFLYDGKTDTVLPVNLSDIQNIYHFT